MGGYVGVHVTFYASNPTTEILRLFLFQSPKSQEIMEKQKTDDFPDQQSFLDEQTIEASSNNQ